jgi:hypothetical protein
VEQPISAPSKVILALFVLTFGMGLALFSPLLQGVNLGLGGLYVAMFAPILLGLGYLAVLVWAVWDWIDGTSQHTWINVSLPVLALVVASLAGWWWWVSVASATGPLP